jgi:AraC family transcriptional regulator
MRRPVVRQARAAQRRLAVEQCGARPNLARASNGGVAKSSRGRSGKANVLDSQTSDSQSAVALVELAGCRYHARCLAIAVYRKHDALGDDKEDDTSAPEAANNQERSWGTAPAMRPYWKAVLDRHRQVSASTDTPGFVSEAQTPIETIPVYKPNPRWSSHHSQPLAQTPQTMSNDHLQSATNHMEARDVSKNVDTALRGWERELQFRESLQVIATSPLPPPMTGNSCILEGTIPDFLGVRDPDNAAISFLTKGNPITERRDQLGTTTRQLKPGSFSITPPGSDYEFRTTGQHTSLNIAINNSSLILFAEQEVRRPIANVQLFECLDSRHPAELTHLLKAFAHLISGSRQNSALYAQSLWTQIALQLLWHYSSLAQQEDPEDTAALTEKPMDLVREYIETNLGLDISLNELAALANLSPGHFLRAFKKATGSTPLSYRNSLRIERACDLLRHSSLSMSRIALDLGFASSSHFSDSFRRHYGMSPSMFRATHTGLD